MLRGHTATARAGISRAFAHHCLASLTLGRGLRQNLRVQVPLPRMPEQHCFAWELSVENAPVYRQHLPRPRNRHGIVGAKFHESIPAHTLVDGLRKGVAE